MILDSHKDKKPALIGRVGPVSISLLMHAALMLLIGGIVIIDHVIPKGNFQPTLLGQSSDQIVPEDTIVDELDIPDASDLSDMAVDTVSVPESAPVSGGIDALAVDTASSSSSWMITAGSNSSAPMVGIAKFGTGGTQMSGGAASSAKPRMVGNIFGKKVEAEKLGVILDVSGSAHDFLLPAMTEIEKSFKDSPAVMAIGCGMGKLDGMDVEVVTYGKFKGSPGRRTSLAELSYLSTKPDMAKFIEKLKKRSDVYAINGGDINATQLGFLKLADEGCDTIYWFADFEDALDPRILDETMKILKDKGIKVIVHNFTGKEGGKGWNDAVKLAKKTDGDTIVKIP